MILIDTDHLSVLADRRHSAHPRLHERIKDAVDGVGIPVVGVEEQLRSWLAEIRRSRSALHEVLPYRRLLQLIRFLNNWIVVEWDEAAAQRLLELRRARIRIGTQDLKIAAIALVHDALLLSANRRDFERVPGLQLENWLR
jgi:tRNA(fMet)-specific endonuclease VapC